MASLALSLALSWSVSFAQEAAARKVLVSCVRSVHVTDSYRSSGKISMLHPRSFLVHLGSEVDQVRPKCVIPAQCKA